MGRTQERERGSLDLTKHGTGLRAGGGERGPRGGDIKKGSAFSRGGGSECGGDSTTAESASQGETPTVRAKDEVYAEIRSLVDSNSALQLSDFDYRVRQHLHALYGSGGRQRVREGLQAVHTATMQKSREAVRNWPAYIRTLLKNYDQDVAVTDREARARARIAAAATTPEGEEGVSDLPQPEGGKGKEEVEVDGQLFVAHEASGMTDSTISTTATTPDSGASKEAHKRDMETSIRSEAEDDLLQAARDKIALDQAEAVACSALAAALGDGCECDTPPVPGRDPLSTFSLDAGLSNSPPPGHPHPLPFNLQKALPPAVPRNHVHHHPLPPQPQPVRSQELLQQLRAQELQQQWTAMVAHQQQQQQPPQHAPRMPPPPQPPQHNFHPQDYYQQQRPPPLLQQMQQLSMNPNGQSHAPQSGPQRHGNHNNNSNNNNNNNTNNKNGHSNHGRNHGHGGRNNHHGGGHHGGHGHGQQHRGGQQQQQGLLGAPPPGHAQGGLNFSLEAWAGQWQQQQHHGQQHSGQQHAQQQHSQASAHHHAVKAR